MVRGMTQTNYVITSKGLNLKPIQSPQSWALKDTNNHVRFYSTDFAQSFATSSPVMLNKTETPNVPEQDETTIMGEEASSNLVCPAVNGTCQSCQTSH